MSERNEYNRLQELGGSDFEIADGQPNIKGWDVKDEKGEYIGEVDELLFDPQSRKVRYIVLDLEGNAFDLDAREVLVPIGIAALHENDDDVILTGVSAEQLRSLPDYDKHTLNADTENSIRTAFASTNTHTAVVATASESHIDFYDHDHFNESNLYKNRDTRLRNSMTSGDSSLKRDRDMQTDENRRLRLRMRNETAAMQSDGERLNAEEMPADRPVADNSFSEDAVSMHARTSMEEKKNEERNMDERNPLIDTNDGLNEERKKLKEDSDNE